MKPIALSVALLCSMLIASAASACIEALTLQEMVNRTDMAVVGKVTGIRSVYFAPPGMEDRYVYTLVEVEGHDLYSGAPAKLEGGFIGGTYQGITMLNTAMPSPSDYKVGRDVLMFSSEAVGLHPSFPRWMHNSYGGLYVVHNGVVFGRGEGFPVDRNLRLADLNANIQHALKTKQEKQSG